MEKWNSVPSGPNNMTSPLELKSQELVKEMKGNKSTMASANREPQDDKKEDKRSSDRAKSLDTALAQIERQFGKGSVMITMCSSGSSLLSRKSSLKNLK